MLFSIIVPIYNISAYLRECVESVLCQSCGDFELILVDDGSTDGCAQIVDSYACRDGRVVAIHKENGGVSSARKAGARQARGEYVVILDGDDWLAPQALQVMAAAIDRYRPDLLCSGYYKATGAQYQKISPMPEECFYRREELEKKILPHLLVGDQAERAIIPNLWAKAMERKLYLQQQEAVSDRIAMGEDGAVVYPLVCRANAVCFLPDALYYYRINPDSATQRKGKQIPWEGALLRIDHFRTHLPLERFDLKRQLGCYAAHSIFNVILTQMRHRKYAQVTKEARQILRDQDLLPLIRQAGLVGDFPEKLAQIAISHRWFFLIKLYSLLR